MSVAPGKDVVGVGHKNHGTAFDTVLVDHIKTDIVFNIKHPKSFVVLKREAE